ncbi:MAG: AI-2E family transporter [Actinomycetota bacterium]|nr:AI-2E family transporter [Actinomycetota bacterium]
MSYWMKVAVGLLVVFVIARSVAAISNVILLIVASLVLAIGMQPAISWLERRGTRRGWAVAFIFLAAVVIVGGFLAVVIPIVIKQLAGLVAAAPGYLTRAQHGNGVLAQLDDQFNLMGKLKDLSGQLPTTAFAIAKSFTTLVFNTITVFILTAYFASALPQIRRGVARLLTREHREGFIVIMEEATARIGGYVMGNLVVSLIAGGVAVVGLFLIGVPYAVVLGVWVAIADLIPVVGAYLGAIPALVVAAFIGLPQLLGTLVLFVVYQQLENYVIAPRVMKRAVDMSPAAVIVALLVGGSLAGFVGALLSLPIAAILKIIARELYVSDRIEEVKEADQQAVPSKTAHRRRRRWRRGRPEDVSGDLEPAEEKAKL